MRRAHNVAVVDAGLRIERSQPIAPQIYAALRQRIVHNRLPAGAILTETALAAPLDPGRFKEAVVRRLAKRHAAARDLSQCLEAQEPLAARDDYAGFFREDETFHERLAASAGMPNVWRLVQSVKGHVDRQRSRLTSGIPMRSQRAHQDHCRILAHVLAGDADAAAMAMRAHVHWVLELHPPSGTDEDAGPATDR